MFSYIQLIHNQHSTTCWPIYQLCNDRVLTNLLGRCTDWVFSLYISPYCWTTPTLSLGVPFVLHWKLGPLARSNDIPVLNGFVNTIDWDLTWPGACTEWRVVHESRTSGVGPGQRSQSPSLTKRIAASGNKTGLIPHVPAVNMIQVRDLTYEWASDIYF